MKGEHPVSLLCEVLGVSCSGYYRWQSRPPTSRQREGEQLSTKILAAHERSRRNYGAPRLVAELREEGAPISKRRCARLMKAHALRGRKSTVVARARPTAITRTRQRPICWRNNPLRAARTKRE